MFFRNGIITLFIKFLWVGLVFGVIAVVLKTMAKICKKNVVVVNALTFLFWISLSFVYLWMCVTFNNYAFSGIGAFGIILGVIIIKISIDFFFDYFIRFIYNEFILQRGKNGNGKRKIQASKKV